MNGIQLNSWANNLDDVVQTKGIVRSFMFIDIGTIKVVNGRFVDVVVGLKEYTNIEILDLGGAGYSVSVTPIVGDLVLLLCPKFNMSNTALKMYSASAIDYGIANLKAIPICSSTTALSKITVSAEGFTFQDVNMNTVNINSTGITVKDMNNNNVQMSAAGINITDANGNTVQTSAAGVVINNKLTVLS